MGLGVYLENQIHERMYVGHAGGRLERVLVASAPGSLLRGVHLHGDTMFNAPQMAQLAEELDTVAGEDEGLREDAEELKCLLAEGIRRRGYLWISGD